MTYENRIVKYGLEPLDNILFHPENWRIHPVRQQEAVDGVMSLAGIVKPVLINMRTSELWDPSDRGVETLIDGHMRVVLARKKGNTHIPTVYVDLDPEEEQLILATLDPLGALAGTDSSKLLALAAQLDEQTVFMKAALRGAGVDIRETFAHIAPVIAGTDDEQDGAPSEANLPEAGKPRQEPERQVYTAGEGAPGAQSYKPSDREKYPLAIVLDRRDYDRWLSWKAICNQTSDTLALRALLDNATDGSE